MADNPSETSATLSPAEAWSRILERARLDLPKDTFRSFLEPTEALRFDGSTIVVAAPDQFAVDWNDRKHAELLAQYAPVALGHPLTVVFEVNQDRRTRPQMDLFVAPPATGTTANASAGSHSGAPLSARYTFEHFVIGKSNELAAAAAQAAAQAPGKQYNPLFLYGGTGLGKTHLMQAVAHDVLKRLPQTRITYVGTEQFTNEMIAAIGERTNYEFRRRYRETDILLVDDVQFLRGKAGVQEEFFHTFNALYEANRQIVLTCDRPPPEIPGLESRLVSRFQCGMVADIEAPGLEHRIAILHHKAKLDHLELTIPEDVIGFIAEHIRSNVRELEGALIKLLAYASLKHREITMEVAHDALRDKLRAAGGNGADAGLQALAEPSVTIDVIQDLVAREWGVTPDGLKSKTRTKTLTTPRQVAMFLCRELLGIQLVEIGHAFGGRDHSTVIHSLERVTTECTAQEGFRSRVEKLRTTLQRRRG
jgi:chromosomal replication initiator protein